MPEIPSFTAGPTPFERDTAHIDPSALAAPGLALERAGAQTEKLAGDVAELVQRHNVRAYNEALADATNTAYDTHEAAKAEARRTGDYQGFTQKQLAGFDQYQAQAIENAPSAVQGQLTRRFAALRKGIETRSASFEHQMGSETALANIGQDIDQTGTRVYRDPSLLFDKDGQQGEVTRLNAGIEAAGMTGDLNPEQRYKLRRQAGTALTEAAIRGRAESDPAGLAADFKSGRYDEFLTPQLLERITPFVSGARARAAGNAVAGNMFGGIGQPAAPGAPSADDPRGMIPVIRASAARYGVDPDVALKVARSEGLGDFAGDGKTSFGAFQLHVGGGLGDEFRRDTGLDPADPKNEPATIDYAMRRLADTGWSPYRGAARAGVGAREGIGNAPRGGPDLDSGLAAVQRQVDSGALTPEEGDKASGIVARRYHEWHQATTQERAALIAHTEDATAMLASGRDAAVDTAGIRHLLPAEKADEILRKVDEARELGNAVNRVQFASPADLADLQAKTMEGLRDPTDFARKQRQAKALGAAIDQRQTALDPQKGDPAAYAMAAPAVDAAFRAVDPANPGPGTQAAIAASLAEQERLGVPEQNRRALPKPWAAEEVKRLIGTDPAKADIGLTLGQEQLRYGAYWPQVYGDLVKAGLPGPYKIFAGMSEDSQAVARVDMQNALKVLAEPQGLKKLKEAAQDATAHTIIDGAIAERMSDFGKTIKYNGPGGIDLYDQTRDAVQTLAYYYAAHGASGSVALENAYKGVIGLKYDFNDTWRAPKGSAPIVERAADYLRGQVTPEELGPIPGRPELTQEQRQQIYARGIRRGFWVPNAADDSLVLMLPTLDGGAITAKRGDGSRVEFKFGDAPAIAAKTNPGLPEPQGLAQ